MTSPSAAEVLAVLVHPHRSLFEGLASGSQADWRPWLVLDRTAPVLDHGPRRMDQNASLRQHLRDLLLKGNAHVEFDKAVSGLPIELRGAKPPGVPHTPWRLVEHLRTVQWDILEFSRDPAHVSPEFPEGYWPKGDAPPDDLAWDQTLARFRADRQAMVDLVSNPEADLFAPIPHGDGQTLLREALLVADHNAYHLGELIVVRRGLGAWSG